MDLNGDTDDDLDQIWDEPEPDIQVSKSPFPPTRSLGFLFLLAAGIGGQVYIVTISMSQPD